MQILRYKNLYNLEYNIAENNNNNNNSNNNGNNDNYESSCDDNNDYILGNNNNKKTFIVSYNETETEALLHEYLERNEKDGFAIHIDDFIANLCLMKSMMIIIIFYSIFY